MKCFNSHMAWEPRVVCLQLSHLPELFLTWVIPISPRANVIQWAVKFMQAPTGRWTLTILCSCPSLRPGARDPEADLQAQTGAEEAADAPRGGAAAGRRPCRPALRPAVWRAPPAAGEGQGGAVSAREGPSQTEVGMTHHQCRPFHCTHVIHYYTGSLYGSVLATVVAVAQCVCECNISEGS